ncbi:MAG TPA: PEP-CTERM sorting domain-containing protein [Albitalea sp.]|nr:PEP-CTERM sorting domain-containing protein [Albitalea sp.]
MLTLFAVPWVASAAEGSFEAAAHASGTAFAHGQFKGWADDAEQTHRTWSERSQGALTGDAQLAAGTNDMPGGSTIDVVALTPAIPEPGTVALMLSGLAAIGFVIRRRRGN